MVSRFADLNLISVLLFPLSVSPQSKASKVHKVNCNVLYSLYIANGFHHPENMQNSLNVDQSTHFVFVDLPYAEERADALFVASARQ